MEELKAVSYEQVISIEYQSPFASRRVGVAKSAEALQHVLSGADSVANLPTVDMGVEISVAKLSLRVVFPKERQIIGHFLVQRRKP